MLRFRHLAASALVLASCADQPDPVALPEASPAPLLTAGGQDQSLQDRYIVVFKPTVRDVDATVDQLVREQGIGEVHYRYRAALKGFAATLPDQALEGVRRNPNVEFVEADGLATISAGTQPNPPSWGLDRVDEQARLLNQSYSYQNEGQTVEAYILDTGIRYSHQEFAGNRAVTGRDFVSNDDLSEDCHGHGTHVAGTVGGNTTGLAKQVKLVGVRVLGCDGSGSYSGIIAAVDWVTQQKQQRSSVPMVGNMSLGGVAVTSLNTAVDNSVDAGVVWAVAAGNDNGADACTKSPASAAKALTVGASTSTDARASFSNIGLCLDLFAPGSGITSSTFNADNSYASWSGTSMASPHVAGVAALYLSANPNAAAATVNTAIVNGATTGLITNAGTNSPNRLLYSLIAAVAPTPPAAPTADITANGSNGPISIPSNTAVTISWSSSNATSCSVSPRSWTGTSGSQSSGLLTATTTYTVNCTGAGGSASDQVVVNVTSTPPADVHVGDLDGSTNVTRKNWKATVTVTVHNDSHASVNGATVTFALSGAATGTGSCTTSNGVCSFTTGALKNVVATVTFTVTSVSATGLNYVASSNHEPDGDSNGTTITVIRQ